MRLPSLSRWVLPGSGRPASGRRSRASQAGSRSSAWSGRARAWSIWWLISALCIYSASSSLLRILGPQHWHTGTQASTQVATPADLSGAVFSQLRRLVSGVHALSDALHARAHALGVTPHQHSHSTLLRHWHDQGDDSVRLVNSVSLDPELADLKACAAMGGATLLLALGPDNAWRLPAAASGAWPATLATAWRNADLAPSAEPPIG